MIGSHGRHGSVRGRVLLLVAAWIGLGAGAARAEVAVGGCLGAALTPANDVTLAQGGGTRLTFRGVSWEDQSFKPPLYFGVRAGYWFPRASHWGVFADFTHAKMIARLDRAVAVRGTRAGVPVDDTESLGDTFDELTLSHGFNLVTLNAMHRWLPAGVDGRLAAGRVRPYASLGAGVAVPHVQVQTAGATTTGYQVAGLALQAGVGAELAATRHLAFFAEYRLTHARVTADLSQGGTIAVRPWMHHFMLGMSPRLWN